MSRRFGLVFAAEGVGCAAVSWLCVITHHVAFIAAANIAIVGLHFLPLARIVSVPRYYVTGALMFAVSAIAVIGIPTALRSGQGLAIYSVPSLACSPILIGTALLGVREAWMGISASAAPV